MQLDTAAVVVSTARIGFAEQGEKSVMAPLPFFLSFYRPKDGKEDLGPHAYAIRNSSYSFHARVHGDLSVSIRLPFPYECGSAYLVE